MRLALALLLVACSSPTVAPRDCTPGMTSACVCPSGGSAIQVCGTDGRLGACMCPDAGELPDASPTTDRPDLPDGVTARDAGLEAAVLPDVPLATDRPEPDAALPSADVPRDTGGCDDASVCAGRCVNLQSDPTNCGACGMVCMVSRPHVQAVCFAARCATRCEEGWTNCDRNDANGCEVNTGADRMNCGGCGIICPLAEQCVMESCRRR